MKSYLFTAALLTGTMLAVTSCSNEDAPYGGEEGMTVFSVKLPDDLGTRAPFGDAPSNQELNVAIYEAGNTEKALFTSINGVTSEGMTVEQFAADGLTATVKVPLVKNKQYDLVFWSQDKTNRYYTYTENGQTLTVGYGEGEGATVENYLDSRDAFFASKTVTSGDAANSQTIQLKRMFAQINVGTNDLKAYTAAGGSDSFGITVSGVATEINLKSGIVSNPAGTVTATTANAASSETDFPAITGYTGNKLQYLSMIYVLVGDGAAANKTNVDVSLYANGTDGFATYANVPVQMNYRTNIYGALLTNPEVFNVTIDPIFAGEYNNEMKAETADDLANAFQSPAELIEVPKSIDASSLTPEQLKFNTPKTLKLAPDAVITLPANANIEANANLTIVGGSLQNSTDADATPNADGSMNLITIRSGNLTLDGTTLNNNPNYHYHGKTTNSSAVTYYGGVESVNISNVTINSGEFALCGMNRGNNNAEVNISNSTFSSTSSNVHNGKNWSYAVRLYGKTAVLNNCTVSGIQGALSTDSGIQCTINGGNYYTVNTPGKSDAFYALYATDNSVVTINGGYFYGPVKRTDLAIDGTSCVVSGNNDVGLPEGSIIINGGYFSGKPYNHVTNTIYEPTSLYQYQLNDPAISIDGREYSISVVKK